MTTTTARYVVARAEGPNGETLGIHDTRNNTFSPFGADEAPASLQSHIDLGDAGGYIFCHFYRNITPVDKGYRIPGDGSDRRATLVSSSGRTIVARNFDPAADDADATDAVFLDVSSLLKQDPFDIGVRPFGPISTAQARTLADALVRAADDFDARIQQAVDAKPKTFDDATAHLHPGAVIYYKGDPRDFWMLTSDRQWRSASGQRMRTGDPDHWGPDAFENDFTVAFEGLA